LTATQAEQAGARVEARNLCRHFGALAALDDISLDVERGETFGLLGANGAGKTTFIRLLTGYLIPTGGRVTIDGQSPTESSRAVHRRLGFAAERPMLYPDLRVVQYLRFAGGLHGLSGAALSAAVETSLSRFDLEDHATRLIGNLSKGYQQRVSLAQAFLGEPSLLVVDEPTSGLDPLQRGEVRDIIGALRGQRTVILCTHDLAEARKLTSRAAILFRGRLMAVGPTEELLGGGDALGLFRGELPARRVSA
jgi:ABC-2 type transport system ATP-binding protein